MTDYNNVILGIIIGATGGACASLLVIIVVGFRDQWLKCRDKKRIYSSLQKRLKEKNIEWASTRTISSLTNLTMDRVTYICSIHKNISLSTGERDDMWGINKS